MQTPYCEVKVFPVSQQIYTCPCFKRREHGFEWKMLAHTNQEILGFAVRKRARMSGSQKDEAAFRVKGANN